MRRPALRAQATAAAVMSVVVIVVPTSVAADERSGSISVGPYPIYDSTFYGNVNLVEEGAIRATTVGPGVYPEGHESEGQGWCAEGTPFRAQREAPSEGEFKAHIENMIEQRGGPGPVVLDFECIQLTSGNRVIKEQRRDLWLQLLGWTREVAGGRLIGIYNLLMTTAPWESNRDLATDIAAHADVFFPNMYTMITNERVCEEDNKDGWILRLALIRTRAAEADSSKLFIPYIWPQYYPTCPELAGDFVSGDIWRWELDTLDAGNVDGVVIWSGKRAADSTDWFGETVDFMNS